MLDFTQDLMQSQTDIVPASQTTGSGLKFEKIKQYWKNVDLRYPPSKG